MINPRETIPSTGISFNSILFINRTALSQEAPAFFTDLNLVQVVASVTYGKEEYHLESFFHTPLHDEAEIVYRQEVMRDLENANLLNCVVQFSEAMRAMRWQLPDPKAGNYKHQDERFFLEAVNIYCAGIQALFQALKPITLASSGLLAFRKYLSAYLQSPAFLALVTDTTRLLTDLASIEYCVLTNGLKVQVLPYREETDYSAEVDRTFEKFSRNPVKDYRAQFTPTLQMNHVEASILEGVATLYPQIFTALDDYCARNAGYQDETIRQFDREIQFYVSWLEYISKMKQAGLPFCYPKISGDTRDIYDYESFDLALASQMVKNGLSVVRNDFYLKDGERVFVVSGPNQGGKTTFARTFGQLHYLAALGCPIPGQEAKLYLFDRLFTHFEKMEHIGNLRSKLEDDLFRLHSILLEATPNSIIILNEILSSTTLQDAILLSKKIMEQIVQLDAICVWVSFIEELLTFSGKTVSMVSTVVPGNPSLRTFKIERKPADGLAYALSIAEKYKVTYTDLQHRINT
ncbi:MAG TPA: hypothetical protein VHE34_00620 [Puia sp.]|uniref:MutS-related protein n=1 Tax=Puia sp. TaxID=2045100 RepID=UPI002BF4D5B1|nr:hypothetical protein [Puia sp.]HVU93688.1 hypothetical protein [Puia sp.]